MNVKELATQVATHLNSCWSLSTTHDATASNATLVNGPALLHIGSYSVPGGMLRINISGSFSQDLYKHRSYNAERHGITVSSEKDANLIASDITRRLLPSYEAELKTLVERRDASNAYDTAKHSTYVKALRFVNKVDNDSNGDRMRTYVGPANFTLEANNETTVELNRFQLTPAQLLRIKEVVPELFAEVQS